ncbi:MAG: ATP synthase subunit b [Desulfotomaculum sp. 46_296]|nr:MAG: ATP synthase subunit b [Desulfotomaculum sp. 46_296]
MLEFNATLIAQMFNFVILLIFLRFVAYKPIAKLLKDRQDFIANNVATAEEERKQAQELREQYLADMQKAREEAQAIIAQAAKVGEIQAQEIIAAAKEESNRVKDNALKEIEREKEKAVRELRDQVTVLSVAVAGKIIGQTITPEIQHDMVQQFIREAGDLPC